MPAADINLRLYVIDCGYMDMREWTDFETFYGMRKDQVELAAQANPCFLVVHDKGTLVWDAGFSDSTSATPTIDEHGVTVKMPHKLKAQLQDAGHPVETIDVFAISHLHFDHLGNLPYFSNAKILIQQSEIDAAFSERNRNNPGYKREYITPLLEFPGLLPLQGDYDVFGDGSVLLIPAPGHTPGSQIMLISLKEYGPVLISGDALHFSEELKLRITPLFHESPEQANKTIDTIQSYASELGAELWIQHDPIQDLQRRKSPEYYD